MVTRPSSGGVPIRPSLIILSVEPRKSRLRHLQQAQAEPLAARDSVDPDFIRGDAGDLRAAQEAQGARRRVPAEAARHRGAAGEGRQAWCRSARSRTPTRSTRPTRATSSSATTDVSERARRAAPHRARTTARTGRRGHRRRRTEQRRRRAPRPAQADRAGAAREPRAVAVPGRDLRLRDPGGLRRAGGGLQRGGGARARRGRHGRSAVALDATRICRPSLGWEAPPKTVATPARSRGLPAEHAWPTTTAIEPADDEDDDHPVDPPQLPVIARPGPFTDDVLDVPPSPDEIEHDDVAHDERHDAHRRLGAGDGRRRPARCARPRRAMSSSRRASSRWRTSARRCARSWRSRASASTRRRPSPRSASSWRCARSSTRRKRTSSTCARTSTPRSGRSSTTRTRSASWIGRAAILEEKTLGFERSVVASTEKISELLGERDKSVEREKGLKARLDDAHGEIHKSRDEVEAIRKRMAQERRAREGRDGAGARRLRGCACARPTRRIAPEVGRLKDDQTAGGAAVESAHQTELGAHRRRAQGRGRGAAAAARRRAGGRERALHHRGGAPAPRAREGDRRQQGRAGAAAGLGAPGLRGADRGQGARPPQRDPGHAAAPRGGADRGRGAAPARHRRAGAAAHLRAGRRRGAAPRRAADARRGAPPARHRDRAAPPDREDRARREAPQRLRPGARPRGAGRGRAGGARAGDRPVAPARRRASRPTWTPRAPSWATATCASRRRAIASPSSSPRSPTTRTRSCAPTSACAPTRRPPRRRGARWRSRWRSSTSAPACRSAPGAAKSSATAAVSEDGNAEGVATGRDDWGGRSLAPHGRTERALEHRHR